MVEEITDYICGTFFPLSVEVNSDNSIFNVNNNTNEYMTSVSTNDRYDPNDTFQDVPVSGSCNYNDLVEAINPAVESNDFGPYTQQLIPDTLQDIFKFPEQDTTALALNNYSSTSSIRTKRPDGKVKGKSPSISLSHSVGVSVPQIFVPRKDLEIVHDLEETFRPRYKSDYFGQNGKKRKPRYVADRLGNHYVTLRVPPGVSGFIRVDWLTVETKSKQRYSMPYHFQVCNESPDVPDQNPFFVEIPQSTKSDGIIKLYLVLIKSKQDALKTAQPLRLFQPLTDAFGRNQNTSGKIHEIMTPKKLIQEFKLEQSQLAFTLCTSTDDKSSITLWHTTVFSTIMTEITTDTSSRQKVECPKCNYTFDPPSNGDDGKGSGNLLKGAGKKRKLQPEDWQKKLPVLDNTRKRLASEQFEAQPILPKNRSMSDTADFIMMY